MLQKYFKAQGQEFHKTWFMELWFHKMPHSQKQIKKV